MNDLNDELEKLHTMSNDQLLVWFLNNITNPIVAYGDAEWQACIRRLVKRCTRLSNDIRCTLLD